MNKLYRLAIICIASASLSSSGCLPGDDLLGGRYESWAWISLPLHRGQLQNDSPQGITITTVESSHDKDFKPVPLEWRLEVVDLAGVEYIMDKSCEIPHPYEKDCRHTGVLPDGIYTAKVVYEDGFTPSNADYFCGDSEKEKLVNADQEKVIYLGVSPNAIWKITVIPEAGALSLQISGLLTNAFSPILIEVQYNGNQIVAGKTTITAYDRSNTMLTSDGSRQEAGRLEVKWKANQAAEVFTQNHVYRVMIVGELESEVPIDMSPFKRDGQKLYLNLPPEFYSTISENPQIPDCFDGSRTIYPDALPAALGGTP